MKIMEPSDWTVARPPTICTQWPGATVARAASKRPNTGVDATTHKLEFGEPLSDGRGVFDRRSSTEDDVR